MVVASIMTTVNSVTYGTLLFAHPAFVGANVPNGVVVWLLATCAAQVGVSLFSGLPTGIGTPVLEMIPIFHAIFSRVAEELPDADGNEVLGTCLATTFLGTLSLGALLVLGSSMGFSRYLRAVPLVVLKGALFGVAIFLLQSAVTMTKDPAAELLESWQHVGLAVALGTCLLGIDEKLHSPTIVAVVLVCIALAPQVLDSAKVASFEDLRSDYWIFPAAPSGDPMPWYRQLAGTYAEAMPGAHWGVAFRQMPAVMGLWLTHVLCTLMDLKAIELLTQTEIDLDEELRAVGVGNIVSAFCGAWWPTYMVCSQNVTAYKLGGRTRVVGIVVLASTVPAMSVAQALVPTLPRALPGCVAWWLGLLFIKETMVDVMRQHTHVLDVAIVASMAVLITSVGFLEGLFVGLLLAMTSFTLQYSGAPAVVRAVSDAQFFRSNVDRPLQQQAVLERLGHRIAVVHVEGYLMFGSSPQLVDTVRPLVGPGGPEWVVLQFRGVGGLDYSAVLDLVSLGRVAAQSGKRMVLTELQPKVQAAMARAGVQMPVLESTESSSAHDEMPLGLCRSEHYHQALKCCEDAILTDMGMGLLERKMSDPQADATMVMLQRVFGDFLDNSVEDLQTLAGYMEEVEYQPGAVLYEAGKPATLFVGVVRGSLNMLMPTSIKGGEFKLGEVVIPGGFVGFLSVLNQMPNTNSATVPADGEACLVVVFHWGRFSAFLEEHPRVGNAVLRAFLRRLAYEWRDLSRLASSV